MAEFRWDPTVGRYLDNRNRLVPRAEVRQVLDYGLERADRRVRMLAEALRKKKITRAQWLAGMRREIKHIHIYSATAARGGWAQMAQADWGRVGSILRRQYGFLNEFYREIVNGYPLDGRFLARVELYTEAGRGTFHVIDEQVQRSVGMTQERNLLGPADHCDECRAASRRGWVPVGTLPKIGLRQCKVRCKCRIQYRQPAEVLRRLLRDAAEGAVVTYTVEELLSTS